MTALTDIRVLAFELADRISAFPDQEWKPGRHPDLPDHATLTNTAGLRVTIAPTDPEGRHFQVVSSVGLTDPQLADHSPELGHQLYSTRLDTRSTIEDLGYAVRCDVIAAVEAAAAICQAAKDAADEIDRARRALLDAMSEAMDGPHATREDDSRYARTWTFDDARVLIETAWIVCSATGEDRPAFHIHLTGPAEYGPDATQYAQGFLTDYYQHLLNTRR
ncbi:hypothetical protein [Nocardia tengchongensis]|uniref:hypothetical protein n=1 Tax=Nocardia tengchongensis TaxID=2055889 RepID=UPI00368D8FCC